ncbi:hypothetical protein TELCIR_07924 [Teladorsagia circumcincta]|uniref:Uncharacterized protein n=1 Tax=Teladorsagia circumcincta TaxID=45464 RepID=A0A2G9UJ17_TELCI|nr:hypothetical protein TELCIR_07924 [Teladorsagia circumcincta]
MNQERECTEETLNAQRWRSKINTKEPSKLFVKGGLNWLPQNC